MRLLLDTHIALWAITDSPKLSKQAKELILDSTSEIFVSASSIWEIAIKHSLNRGNMPVSSSDAISYIPCSQLSQHMLLRLKHYLHIMQAYLIGC